MYQVNIENKHSRYRARQLGIDVPKQKPGPKRLDLESYIDKSGDCWNWVGFKNQWGYGTFMQDKEKKFAHREMYKRYVGEIPYGFVVLHKCDNPACCNPSHLSAGTHRDNQMDKVEKNRQARGESQGLSKLTEKDVIELRQRYSFGDVTYKMLAESYGVSKDTIQKAVRCIYWRHI